MIRNVHKLPNVSSEFSHDKDLISLFDSSAQYLISRSRYHRLKGRRVQQLSDVYDYTTWKVRFQDTRGNVTTASLQNSGQKRQHRLLYHF